MAMIGFFERVSIILSYEAARTFFDASADVTSSLAVMRVTFVLLGADLADGFFVFVAKVVLLPN